MLWYVGWNSFSPQQVADGCWTLIRLCVCFSDWRNMLRYNESVLNTEHDWTNPEGRRVVRESSPANVYYVCKGSGMCAKYLFETVQIELSIQNTKTWHVHLLSRSDRSVCWCLLGFSCRLLPSCNETMPRPLNRACKVAGMEHQLLLWLRDVTGSYYPPKVRAVAMIHISPFEVAYTLIHTIPLP